MNLLMYVVFPNRLCSMEWEWLIALNTVYFSAFILNITSLLLHSYMNIMHIRQVVGGGGCKIRDLKKYAFLLPAMILMCRPGGRKSRDLKVCRAEQSMMNYENRRIA